MTKFAFIICAVLLVSGAQAFSWSEGAKNVQDKVDGVIAAAGSQIDVILDAAKIKTNELGEQLKSKAEKVSQELFEQIRKLLTEIKNRVASIISKASGDASECEKIADSLDQIALDAVASMSGCVTEKIELGSGYIESIHKLTDDLRSNLTSVKNEAHGCMENIDGFIAAGKALLCINAAGFKASWMTAQSVPSYSKSVVQLTYLLSTLHLKLPYCAASNGYSKFISDSTKVVAEVQKCVSRHS